MTTPRPADRKPAPADLASRHLWQFQALRDAILIGVVFGLLWLGHRLSVVTVPLLLAVALAYLVEPLVKRMTRLRWMSRQGAAATIIGSAALLVGVPVLAGVGFGAVQAFQFSRGLAMNLARLPEAVSTRDTSRLPPAWQPFGEQLLALDEWWTEHIAAPPAPPAPDAVGPPGEGETPPPAANERGGLARVAGSMAASLQTNAETIAARLGRRAVSTGADALAAGLAFVKSATMLAFGAFLTAFFFFFVSTGWGRVLTFWGGMIPERKRGRAFDLLQKMDRVIAAFIRGRLTIAAILAVLFTLAYALIGVPAPLILGPIVGVLSVVPYLALAGIPVSILLMLLEPAGEGVRASLWWMLAAPVVVYFVIQATDDYLWTPLIQGKATDLDSPTILFAVLAGGALAGFYGVLVAIPVAACAKILLKELVLPRVREWARGKAPDPLPIG